MSVSTISPSQTAAAPRTHHARHPQPAGGPAKPGSASTGATKAAETIEQLAEQGDPAAIAELRAERQPPGASQGRAASGPQPPAERGGASEPGRGAEVDEYA